MTTYIQQTDLDSVLEGFVSKYYGSYIDDGEDITIGSQFYIDMDNSFQQTNEWLSGIHHIKNVPIGTQNGGNFPFHVRMLQANLMVYHRLLGKHYGEFSEGIPGWITTYLRRATETLSDIRGQNVVFIDDVTQGESGIGVGSFVTHTGAAQWFSNWETGFYRAADYPKVFVIQIDGTGGGGQIGSSTFKWSKDGGVSFEMATQTTSTYWTSIDSGLCVRWQPIGTGQQLFIGDRFDIPCIPTNVPVKSGGIRHITFMRG